MALGSVVRHLGPLTRVGNPTLATQHFVQKANQILELSSNSEIKAASTSLSDPEVLIFLMDLWKSFPLDSAGYEATKYYFGRVVGESRRCEVFGSESVDMEQVHLFMKHVSKLYRVSVAVDITKSV